MNSRRSVAVAFLVAVFVLPSLASALGPPPVVSEPPWLVWRSQTVSQHSASPFIETSIALDSQGYPHVAGRFYADGYPTVSGYATFDGVAWRYDTIAPYGAVVGLALDSGDVPHVVHELYDPDTWETWLMYAKKTPLGWVSEYISRPSSEASVMVDPQGGVHVVSMPSSDVEYAYRDPASGAWTVTIARDHPTYLSSIDATMDAQGRVHVAFSALPESRTGPGNVWYGRLESGAWSWELVSNECGIDAEIEVDASANAFIVCSYAVQHLQFWYKRADGSWMYETIVQGAHKGVSAALALDSRGRAHVVYQNFDLREIDWKGYYAVRHGFDDWRTEVIDPLGRRTGVRPDIAMDAQDRPHVSYVLSSDATGKYVSQMTYATPISVSHAPRDAPPS